MVAKVSEPLTKFLFDSLKNKRNIDESFISDVIEIVVNALDLNEYVRGYKINTNHWNNSDGNVIAEYSGKTKKIIFNLQMALDFFKYNLKNLRLDTFDKAAIIYDNVMSVLLHELEHASQYKKITERDQSLEGIILRDSNMNIILSLNSNYFDELIADGYNEEEIYLYFAEKKRRYNKYYKYDPSERLAEYYSHKTMATILKELKTLPNISYYECLKLCQNYLIGYIEGIVPTKFYLEHVCSPEFWPEIEATSKTINFESRASLGLPISEEEYVYLKDTTTTLERIIIK